MGGFDRVGVKAGVDSIFDQLELELELKSIFSLLVIFHVFYLISANNVPIFIL